MITLDSVTKRYGTTRALDTLSLDVLPGRVTGLLGPNGAGKSTLMRVVVGLDHPTSGRALVEGRPIRSVPRPATVVGAHLGGRPWHPRRWARSHLLALARAGRMPAGRVDAVLDAVGLSSVARRRTGGFSLGMAQRLGLASALLGDPRIVLLDEPVNGLDTDGVRWIRALLRRLADEGRTVLVSSHLMSEMQLVADQVVVLGHGRLLADVPGAELAARARAGVLLRTCVPDAAERLRHVLPQAAVHMERDGGDTLFRFEGLGRDEVGRAAFSARIPVLQLTEEPADLEAGYLDLVGDAVRFRAGAVS